MISTAVLVAPIQNFRCVVAAVTLAGCMIRMISAHRNRPANNSSSVSSQHHMPNLAACFCWPSVVKCSSRSIPTSAVPAAA